MAIDSELSSKIATALLTGKRRDPQELRNLKETIIRIHSTLQQLSAESREEIGFYPRKAQMAKEGSEP